MKHNKTFKSLRPWLLLVLVTVGTFVFLRQDAWLYQEPIAQITHVETSEADGRSDQFGNQVTSHEQVITAVVLNGNDKGQVITLDNQYDSSLALTNELQIPQQVFVRNEHNNTWQIKNTKRDYFWIPILVFVVGLMVILFGNRRKTMVLSTLMNVCLFIGFIFIDLQLGNTSIFPVFMVFSVFATLLTTGILFGFRNRRAWTINVTVLTTVVMTLLISFAVFYATNEKGIYYEHMDFVTQNPASLFLAMTLVGVLGAVLDESTDIIVTMDALVTTRVNLTWQEIVQSGREVGQALFGALNNVLLLIFMAEQIPLAVLYLRNGNSWDYTFSATLSLGLIQTLISAIGIVLAVPISIAYFLLFRRTKGGE